MVGVKHLPPVRGVVEDQGDGEFAYAFFDSADNEVGRASITMVDGQTKTFLKYIETYKPHRRLGFGLAMLTTLAQQHATEIVPVRESDQASDFWASARARAGDSYTIADEISPTDLRVLTGALVPGSVKL